MFNKLINWSATLYPGDEAGSHLLKKHVLIPQEITIQMVTFVPFLSGYFEQSLDVLKVSLESLWQNTRLPYDLMIFDNGSCPEVRDYLLELHRKNKIQFLYLSDKNVGLPGGWNALFASAPGKIIAYSDSDVYFYPGWLEACLNLLDTYPNVGMVTGIPLRNPKQYNSRTIQWARVFKNQTHGKNTPLPRKKIFS
jgi:GT2 family glycosyltransferase